MTNSAAKPKLSQVQATVMLWLSQGWGARVSHGSSVEINGERVCNLATLESLASKGLIERDPDGYYWHATDAGKKLSPGYVDQDER